MKLFLSVLLVYLLGFVQADFDIYHTINYVLKAGALGLDRSTRGWSVYPGQNDLTCDTVNSAKWFPESGDVSGNKLGLRCEDGCKNPADNPDGILLLEMHFTNDPLRHFTIYKTKASENDGKLQYQLYGVDGNEYGYCFQLPDLDYRCQRGVKEYYKDPEHKGYIEEHGFSKFRCLSSFDAHDINGLKQNQLGRDKLDINIYA